MNTQVVHIKAHVNDRIRCLTLDREPYSRFIRKLADTFDCDLPIGIEYRFNGEWILALKPNEIEEMLRLTKMMVTLELRVPEAQAEKGSWWPSFFDRQADETAGKKGDR